MIQYAKKEVTRTNLLYPLGLDDRQQSLLQTPDYDDEYYQTDYSIEHIESLLHQIRKDVRNGAFIILKGDPDQASDTRHKNSDFMRVYGLTHRDKQQSLFLGIDVSEFCHSIHSNDGRVLYVFCIDRELYRAAFGYERVRIYIKFDYSEKRAKSTVVISLHTLEKPIKRLFEE